MTVKWAPALAALVAACAAGCQGYRMHVSFDKPPEPVAAAPVQPEGQTPSSVSPQAAPPPEQAHASQPQPPNTAPPPTPDAQERTRRLGELYREWRGSSVYLARRIDEGLEAPATVREEILELRAQLVALLPFLDAPYQAQIQACAEEYAPIADRHRGGSGDTAMQLRILTRKVQRILE